jgi:hypothetical protein
VSVGSPPLDTDRVPGLLFSIVWRGIGGMVGITDSKGVQGRADPRKPLTGDSSAKISTVEAQAGRIETRPASVYSVPVNR